MKRIIIEGDFVVSGVKPSIDGNRLESLVLDVGYVQPQVIVQQMVMKKDDEI